MKAMTANTELHYTKILKQTVIAPDPETRETHLAEAFELGQKALSESSLPPDELVAIHHNALVNLSKNYPNVKLSEIVDQLTLPLLEISMSYGMSFRERLEKQFEEIVNKRLQESHKMEAVGTFATGVAHEFNNILCSIIGFSELAGDTLPVGSAEKQAVDQVLIASIRARDLVKRMLLFARKNNNKPAEPVDAVVEIQDALALVAVQEKQIKINLSVGISPAMITADSGLIQQIIMNLYINAADAMDHQGEITVKLDSTTSEECMINVGESGICITVSDHGCGMSPEIQEQIFNPFFTTKDPGKGTGLGLSVVYNMVRELGGHIAVESRTFGEKRGTDFRIILPFADRGQPGKSCQGHCSLSKPPKLAGA